VAGLTFSDKQLVENVFESMKQDSGLAFIAVFDKNKELFTGYNQGQYENLIRSVNLSDQLTHTLSDDFYVSSTPISTNDELAGFLR